MKLFSQKSQFCSGDALAVFKEVRNGAACAGRARVARVVKKTAVVSKAKPILARSTSRGNVGASVAGEQAIFLASFVSLIKLESVLAGQAGGLVHASQAFLKTKVADPIFLVEAVSAGRAGGDVSRIATGIPEHASNTLPFVLCEANVTSRAVILGRARKAEGTAGLALATSEVVPMRACFADELGGQVKTGNAMGQPASTLTVGKRLEFPG
jgi:hypothetical protein